MDKTINRPRGTQDIYGEKANMYNYVFDKFSQVALLSGFNLIKTPMFESIETFVRSVGETSDIVKKEFYNFVDKGGREIALRPEGTASVIRCVVEDKLLYTNPLPLMFYYYGSMFRYERPQSKRLREFNQFGVEIIGTNSIYDDFSVIKFVTECLNSINIKDTKIKINNLGSFDSRFKWIEELKQYFKPFKSQLTELSQERLSSNPTRILDDKVDGVKDFVKNAPKISKFLTSEEVSEFKVLLKLLDQFNINYIIDETLVRGLDYYTNTVFEISTKDDLALGGGGRYGKLVEEFGGEETSCIGMAFGIDRIIDYIKENKISTDFSNTNVTIVFASLVEEANTKVLEYMAQCRKQGISCVANLSLNKLAKVFNYAEKINAKYVAIIGEAELNNNTITYKDIEKKIQKTVSVNEFFKLI